jgi:integrase
MKDMAKTSYLFRPSDSSNWSFRRVVPQDLVEHFGKRQIKFSLGTSDRKKAEELARLKAVETDRQFEGARRQMSADAITELSAVEVEQITSLWLHQLLEEDEESRIGGLPEHVFEEDEETLDALGHLAKHDLARGNASHIQFEIDDFLDSHGVKLDTDSEAYQRVCYAMQQTWTKALGIMRERHAGEVRPTPPAPAKLPTTPTTDKGAPTLMDIYDLWAKEHIANDGAEKTLSDFETYCRRFTELHGAVPVAAITKAHVRDFKDAMLRFPSRITCKQFKGKTVPQLLEYVEKHPDTPCLSSRTVNDKALGAVGAVLGWAEENAYIENNPASRVKVKGAKVATARRLSYSVEDMNRIFRFPIYTESERMKGGCGEAAYWLPLLAAFTGARLEELGQLHAKDIKRDRDVDFIDMTTLDGDRRLKTEASKRRVPIHPELIRLGFLEYVKQIRKGRLFPELTSKQGKLTASFSQWWGRYARKHGITDKRKVFHSFRHAAKDALREGGVEEQISDAITGHAPQSEGRKYGSAGVPITRLAEGISRLTYPGLDLNHLM